jgi:hypothetical protein
MLHKTNHSLTLTALLMAVLLATVLPISKTVPANADPDKIVYVVIAIDSEGPVDLHKNPGGHVASVFVSGFRNSHEDSFGTPFKMTWYSHMSALIAYGDNGPNGPLLTYTYSDGTPAGVSGCLSLRDILHNNWGPEMAMYGDEDGYHHHFMRWTGSGPYAGWDEYDQGPDDPAYTDHMDTIDHMILDDGFFPSSWRTGWLVQTSGLSNWPNNGYRSTTRHPTVTTIRGIRLG